MSDTATVTATPAPSTPPPSADAPKPTRESTIHDAVEEFFAQREKPQAPNVEPPAENAADSATTSPDGNQVETPQPEELKQEEPPKAEEKVTASDLALEVARAKKILARAKAAPQPKSDPALDPVVLKRAQALAAAGDDPVKQFEALEFDLAKIVQAYDNRAAEDPNFADPLAAQVKSLSEKLSQFEAREAAAKDEAAVTHFMREAETFAQSTEETNFVAALAPLGGLENVKQRVIEAAEGGKPITLAEAIKSAERDLEEVFEAIAKTPKGKRLMAKLFPQTPRSPGVPPQAPKAGTAPEPQKTPTTVQDVINNAIDALGIE